MEKTLIVTNDLVKTFGKTIALDGLEIRTPKGISGFIGENGSGKTTTISILLGLLKPNCGRATIFGLDCWHDSIKIRRRIGVMHEINSCPGNFTGELFLNHVAQLYGISQPKQRVAEMLNDVGLVKVEDKPVKAYSAGMNRRLGLAQALIGDPELAILDEPTANIDPLGRIALLERIRTLHKERGTSFLISTHILSDLEKICEWVSIISKGKIVEQGYIQDLASKYSANVYRIEVSNPELFVEKVRQLNSVEKVWIENNAVYCKVQETRTFCESIPIIITNSKLHLQDFRQIIGTIEEMYKEVSVGKKTA
jgi:ABC-2 type transport system ATP-binding protein